MAICFIVAYIYCKNSFFLSVVVVFSIHYRLLLINIIIYYIFSS